MREDDKNGFKHVDGWLTWRIDDQGYIKSDLVYEWDELYHYIECFKCLYVQISANQ